MIAQLLQHMVVCGGLLLAAVPLVVPCRRNELFTLFVITSLIAGTSVFDWWCTRRSRRGICSSACSILGIQISSSQTCSLVEYLRSQGFGSVVLLLSLMIPIAPLFGPQVVPILTLLWLTYWYMQADVSLRAQFCSLRYHSWIVPIAALIAGSVLYEVSFAGLSVRHGVYRWDGAHPLSVARSFVISSVPSWPMLSRVLLFAACVRVFTLLTDHTKGALRIGLLSGTVLCGTGVLLEYAVGLSWTHASQSSFWTSLQRFSGSVSDPNALGLWMVLAPCATWGRLPATRVTRALLRVSYGIVPLAGLLSGSRTFLLGVAIVLVMRAFFSYPSSATRSFIKPSPFPGALLFEAENRSQYTVSCFRKQGRLALIACAVAIVMVLVTSITDLFFPWIDIISQRDELPVGVRRGVALLSVHRVVENFYSRTVFNQLGFELVRNFPFFGVGADRFRYYVTPLASILAIPIGRWVDNSNNFYLGIWSELGLFGVFALLFALCARCFPVERCGASRGVLILLLLLITGPHLDFPEIAVLGAFLIAEGTAPRFVYEGASTSAFSVGVIGILLAGFVAGSVREHGVYRCSFEEGVCRQWIAPGARFLMQCAPGEQRTLRIEAPHVPHGGEMVVTVEQPGFPPHELRFSQSGEQQFPLQCRRTQSSDESQLSYSTMLSVWTQPGWSPARDGTKRRNDERWLGVVVEGRTPYDLLPRSGRSF